METEARRSVARASARLAVGCLGARELDPQSGAACRKIGADLARAGLDVVTGVTPGVPGRDPWGDWAGGAFAYGAACVAPERLTVCLPWRHFPRGSAQPAPGIRVLYPEGNPDWTAQAAAFWTETHDEGEGTWVEAVPRALRLRHTRNIGVVLRVAMLLIWPEAEDPTTPVAAEFARWRGLPVLDLTQTPWWSAVEALTERARRLAPET